MASNRGNKPQSNVRGVVARGRGRGGRGGGNNSRKDREGDISMGGAPDPLHSKGGKGGVSKNRTNPNARGKENLSRRNEPRNQHFEAALNKGIKDHAKFVESQTSKPLNGYGKRNIDQILVTGLKNSKSASNDDRGERDLVRWLEGKATAKNKKNKGPYVKFENHKYDADRDELIIHVKTSDTKVVLSCDGWEYAGTHLSITVFRQGSEMSQEAKDLRDSMRKILESRYNKDTKTLDLSDLRHHPLFDLLSEKERNELRQSDKFFTGLFGEIPVIFGRGRALRDAIVNINLQNNELLDLRKVSSLSQEVPLLQGLDVSNNQISDVDGFKTWRRKLKALRILYVSNNPFTLSPVYQNWQEELIKWFPALIDLNGTQVRSEQDASANSALHSVDYKVRAPFISDDTGVVVGFVRDLITGFDNDRHALVNAYYDDSSSFTISDNIRTSGDNSNARNHDPYKGLSRNVWKVTTPTTRMDRYHIGQQDIYDVWNTKIPKTRHPDLDQELDQWCIESQMTPAAYVKAPGAQLGVNGHLIILHGKFMQLDDQYAPVIERSFSRAIVVGPGNGPHGLRVVSDQLTIRDLSSPNAWKPNAVQSPPKAPVTFVLGGNPDPVLQPTAAPAPAPAQFAAPVPAPVQPVDTEQAARALLVQQFVEVTKLTPEMAEMCLKECNYEPEATLARYNAVKHTLLPQHYIDGVVL